MRAQHLLSGAILLTFSAFAAACSGGGTASPNSSSADSMIPQSAVQSLAAAPRTWELQVGASTLDQSTQALYFFFDDVTINAGDSVHWRWAGKLPHTVTFLAPGQTPPPPTAPGALAPAGGPAEDGSTFTSSGLMGTAGSYSLKFTKAGDYKYFCLLHQPVMEAMIHVNPAGTTYPHTQYFYTHSGEFDEWGILTEAARSITEFPFTPRGTHIGAGIAHGLFSASAPAEGTVVRFIDTNRTNDTPLGNVTIRNGTTITWTNLSNNEPHTVTIPLPGQTPPPSLSPFNPPIGGHVYDGTHLIHSGPLFPGQSFSVTFTKPGGFYYFCLFHDEEGMVAAVHVNP